MVRASRRVRRGYLPALIATNLRAALALRGAFWLQAAFMFLNNVFFFVTWWIFFERFTEVRGWTLRDMAALYGVVASAFGLTVILLGGSGRSPSGSRAESSTRS